MEMHLDLDSAEGRSKRSRMENALRDAVREGRLPSGTRLPATRALAAELCVSRGVVVEAYAQLAAEGYLRTRRGGGTTVAPAGAVAGAIAAPPPARGAVRHDLNPFRPALSAFPRAVWLAALSRVMRASPDERLGYPDPGGVPELRATLAGYLGRVRGVRAHPAQVVVTSGLRAGVDLLFATLAAAGARAVAVEEPGWRGMRETAAGAGLRVVGVGVDAEGMEVEQLERHPDLAAVAVAPAHQYPTGAVLSPARRARIVVWARERRAWVVEDDYDAEYRYDRQPIGSLQGLAPDRVVYGGSASKTLAPAVRLGWLVLPEELVEEVCARQRLRGGMPSALEQLALADLIERGELDRHLRRQRRLYRARRDALLEELARGLPEATVEGAAAGLYVLVSLPPDLDERAVLAEARARGMALEGLGARRPGVVVGYANLDRGAARPVVATLADAVRAVRAVRREVGGRVVAVSSTSVEGERMGGAPTRVAQ